MFQVYNCKYPGGGGAGGGGGGGGGGGDKLEVIMAIIKIKQPT